MSGMIDEVRFWQQVMTDSERTVYCSPELESRCKGYVAAAGLSGLITVEASRAVPDDRLFVVDHHAVDALTAKVLARPIRINPMADPL